MAIFGIEAGGAERPTGAQRGPAMGRRLDDLNQSCVWTCESRLNRGRRSTLDRRSSARPGLPTRRRSRLSATRSTPRAGWKAWPRSTASSWSRRTKSSRGPAVDRGLVRVATARNCAASATPLLVGLVPEGERRCRPPDAATTTDGGKPSRPTSGWLDRVALSVEPDRRKILVQHNGSDRSSSL